MDAPQYAIHTRALRREYGDHVALDGLDLSVPAGTVHALLGPNGAGKTTAVRILATLLRPTSGSARVAGHDTVREPREVRARIGLLGQHAALDEDLDGRQNLDMFGRLHHLGARGAARRADDMLERFGLTDTGRRPVRAYSGGMRRRLDLAAALLTEPSVLFLDEPTTGLDPRGRAEVWASVRALTGAGTTVLLTTQYLEEADQLADRVSVLHRGRLAAEGSPDQLKARLGAGRVEVVVRDAARLPDARAALAGVGDDPREDADRRRASVAVAEPMEALAAAVLALRRAGVEVEDLALRRASLDEVFLHLTADDAPAAGPAADPAADPAAGPTPAPAPAPAQEVHSA